MVKSFTKDMGEIEFSPSSHGYILDTQPDRFGELRESNDILDNIEALHQRMAEDGYLFLRGHLDRERVLEVRRELVEKLAEAGLINRDRPLMDAIYSNDTSQLAHKDRRAIVKGIRTGARLRSLCHHGPVINFYEGFLGGPVRSLDYIWVRYVRVGQATGVHFDWVYMGRGTRNLYTTWLPIGDIPLADGPLAILEGSHQIEALQASYGQLDVDRDQDQAKKYLGGWLTKDAKAVQANFGKRWLTTDFRAGDMLLFGMFTLHCSLDNKSPENRIRLSVDTRYQPVAEPSDER